MHTPTAARSAEILLSQGTTADSRAGCSGPFMPSTEQRSVSVLPAQLLAYLRSWLLDSSPWCCRSLFEAPVRLADGRVTNMRLVLPPRFPEVDCCCAICFPCSWPCKVSVRKTSCFRTYAGRAHTASHPPAAAPVGERIWQAHLPSPGLVEPAALSPGGRCAGGLFGPQRPAAQEPLPKSARCASAGCLVTTHIRCIQCLQNAQASKPRPHSDLVHSC